jgi:arylsulfatase A-like enzyme
MKFAKLTVLIVVLIITKAVSSQPPKKPNILVIMVDQVRAQAVSCYGGENIQTPAIDKLAQEGIMFTNAISTVPVCTPFRSMFMTGRHPQTTGHVINFLRTRHDEISIADAFNAAGYKTANVGKWHLHTGMFPNISIGRDFVPEGRDRLGFQWWRGYNFHEIYYDGFYNLDDWKVEKWDGYETEALSDMAIQFMEANREHPFFCVLSVHQAHYTKGKFAPEKYYEMLPEEIILRKNIPQDKINDRLLKYYRDYYAMILAIDDMVAKITDYLDNANLDGNTLLMFVSDHGTEGGSHGNGFFHKKMPYSESFDIPLIVRYPGVIKAGAKSNVLIAPVDIFPTLCGLTGTDIPRSVEGYDLSDSWLNKTDAFEQNGVLTMNFTKGYDYCEDGEEWRGIRTKKFNYARWKNGLVELYNLEEDPFEMNNLAKDEKYAAVAQRMENMMLRLMKKRGDTFPKGSEYNKWFDNQRRVIRNAYGPLSNPEDEPDWSLLSEN